MSLHEHYNELLLTIKTNIVPLLSTLSLTINIGTVIKILVEDVAPPMLILCSIVISMLTIYTLVQKVKLNNKELKDKE